jgi:glycosyltransferase involved in cell wall biosynthesis
MSTGLSSVVSDIPANAQLVDDGVHGLRAHVGDSESIASALESLLASPDLRARMGASARLRAVENYSMDRVADRYVTLFREALAASGR